MDNLINFDDNSENSNKNESSKSLKLSNNPIRHPLIVNDRLSFDNPFDKFEYKMNHFNDPFECLEVKQMTNSTSAEESKDQNKLSETELFGTLLTSINSNSKDILNSTDPSPATSTTSSFIATDSESSSSSKNKTLKRCQSDSSTSSANDGVASRYSSVDNIFSSKTNQLLKLSLLNSPNSPLHSSSRTALDGTLMDSVFSEAKKVSEMLNSFNEMSFEDLNNISQHLIDTSNVSDADLEQLKISFLEHMPEGSSDNPSTSEKIEEFQEILKKIKKEKCEEEVKPEVIEVKDEIKVPKSPKPAVSKSDKDVDDILQQIKDLMKDNKKEEAKKHLQKLNDLLNGPDPSKFLQVQPMVRQDTFEIDNTTGRRKYLNNSNCVDENDISANGELMEQLAKIFGAQSLDVGSLNLSSGGNNETKVVVIMPNITPAATPVKQSINSRRSVSFSSQRPSTAFKGIENKKLSTPMKPSTAATSSTVRRSSFTAPRPLAKPHPYEQKLNIGTVRKSLMTSMDKSPSKTHTLVPPRAKNPSTLPPSTNVRRSVSLKANLPSVKISEASPVKGRPPTSASSRNSIANPATRRLSTFSSRPSSTSSEQKGTATANRNKKTEFKAPARKIPGPKESMV